MCWQDAGKQGAVLALDEVQKIFEKIHQFFRPFLGFAGPVALVRCLRCEPSFTHAKAELSELIQAVQVLFTKHCMRGPGWRAHADDVTRRQASWTD